MPVASPAPVTLITGDEELLVDRAVGDVVAAARARDSETEVHDLAAAQVAPHALAELTSPSLFGGGRVVVIRAAQDLAKSVAGEVGSYAADPADDIALVIVHAGGNKGKALLTALTKAGVRKITCSKISRMGERIDFVRAEAQRAGRSMTDEAARTLLDAIGNDLRELAAACSQLAADTTGRIDDAAVARYYRGRAEVSGFNVADRAIEGRLAGALEQLRWALATGVSPVLITSALAQGLRSLAKVGGAPRGLRGAGLAKDLGMPSWKIDRVRQQLRGWTPEGVAQALGVVAETDAQVKGGGADPAYALEKAVAEIVSARGSH
jgi:DNA polymerase III subunit delta